MHWPPLKRKGAANREKAILYPCGNRLFSIRRYYGTNKKLQIIGVDIMHGITLISKLGNGLQAWTFDISEADLLALMEKYDGKGTSVLSDAEGIAEEIKEIYEGGGL